MDRTRHGELLSKAMAMNRVKQGDIADLVGKSKRTVGYWTRGDYMPTLADRELIRGMLGPYDADGDEVELAIRQSNLVKWRQDRVISEYEKQAYEQAREEAG